MSRSSPLPLSCPGMRPARTSGSSFSGSSSSSCVGAAAPKAGAAPKLKAGTLDAVRPGALLATKLKRPGPVAGAVKPSGGAGVEQRSSRPERMLSRGQLHREQESKGKTMLESNKGHCLPADLAGSSMVLLLSMTSLNSASSCLA